MPIDHLRRAQVAWPLLVGRAVNGMSPCTYREVCDEIGVHWRSASHFLGVIFLASFGDIAARAACRRCRCWW